MHWSARWAGPLPVIEEVLEVRVSPDYFRYLRRKFANPAPGSHEPAGHAHCAPSARMMKGNPQTLPKRLSHCGFRTTLPNTGDAAY